MTRAAVGKLAVYAVGLTLVFAAALALGTAAQG